MKRVFYKHRSLRLILAGLFGLVVLAGVGGLFNSEADASGRVVSIFVDGETKTVSSNSDTVEGVLKRANVKVNPFDLVEPGLDTEISEAVFNVNIYRARPFTVVDGHEQKTIMSPYQSPRLIAESAGLTVYPEDEFSLERIDNILEARTVGQRLIIDRALPVTLNMYGENIELRTQAETVAELLEEKDVTLLEGEVLEPAADTKLKPDMTVFVAKVGTAIITEEESIAYEEEIIRDTSLPVGERHVKQAGEVGSKVVTYKIKKRNGQEVGRSVLHSVVTKQPVKQVVVVGVSGSPSPEVWAALRQCEAGGSYTRNSGNGYYGAYQFSPGTWRGYGGTGLPHEAPPEVQDEIALRLWQARGFQPWPGCSSKLGLY